MGKRINALVAAALTATVALTAYGCSSESPQSGNRASYGNDCSGFHLSNIFGKNKGCTEMYNNSQ